MINDLQTEMRKSYHKEALHNVLQHAHRATLVRVCLHVYGPQLVLEVADNGGPTLAAEASATEARPGPAGATPAKACATWRPAPRPWAELPLPVPCTRPMAWPRAFGCGWPCRCAPPEAATTRPRHSFLCTDLRTAEILCKRALC